MLLSLLFSLYPPLILLLELMCTLLVLFWAVGGVLFYVECHTFVTFLLLFLSSSKRMFLMVLVGGSVSSGFVVCFFLLLL